MTTDFIFNECLSSIQLKKKTMNNNQQTKLFILPQVIPNIIWKQLAQYEKKLGSAAKYFFDKLAHQVTDWPKNLSIDDFISPYSQEKDYILALLARDTYWNNDGELASIQRLNSQQLAVMGISESMLRDKKTGLQSNIYRYEDIYFLCFAGSNDLSDLYANFRQGLGYYEPQYFQAVGIVNLLSKAGVNNLICIGHSLGGGLATIAALAARAPAITFSPAGLAANTLNVIGIKESEILQHVDKGLIRYYTVKYDFLDGLQQSLPIPKSIGNRIELPYKHQNSPILKNLPYHSITRHFVAHFIGTIVEMLYLHQPWNMESILSEPLESFECFELGYYQKYNIQNTPMTALYSTIEPLSLHEAALTGKLEQVDVLLSKKIEINQPDNLGNTPLFYALNSHALRSAIKLLENGADWRIRDQQGMNGHDQLKHHIISDNILTDEGRALRATVLNMMQ